MAFIKHGNSLSEQQAFLFALFDLFKCAFNITWKKKTRDTDLLPSQLTTLTLILYSMLIPINDAKGAVQADKLPHLTGIGVVAAHLCKYWEVTDVL